MDQEFNKVEPEIDESIEVNTPGACEHIPEIERSICTTKERCRSIIAVSPFDYFPHEYVIYLVYFAITMLNCLPSRSGLFGRNSTRELVFRRPVYYQRHCSIEFGAMVEASEDATVTNTMASRTYPALLKRIITSKVQRLLSLKPIRTYRNQKLSHGRRMLNKH